jgi:hypothetical protein
MVFAGGVLTKSSGFLLMYLAPAAILLVDLSKKKRLDRVLKWIALLMLAILFGYAYYQIQRLSPWFHIISQKNSIFVWGYHDVLSHPTRFLLGNLNGLFDWLSGYMTYPILLLAAASFLVDRKKYFREKVLLFIWFFAPFFALALFGKTLYPRFIYFMTIPLLALAAYSLAYITDRIKNPIGKIGVATAFLILFIRADYFIMTDIARAPIPKADLEQYINGWPAGGGVREMVDFFKERASQERIYVLTEGTFGSVPTTAMEIYLEDVKNIETDGVYPLPEKIPHDVLDRSTKLPTYFVMYQKQEAPPGWPLKLIREYRKGVGNAYMRIYQVTP